MNIRNLLFVSVTALTWGAPAFAQAGDTPFSGFYVGAELGGAQATSKATVSPITGAPVARESDRTSVDYGGFAGYGVSFDSGLYFGGEVSINRIGSKAKALTVAGIPVREEPSYDGALTGRIGYQLGENTLVYGLAGVAQRESRFTLPLNLKTKANITGRVFGVGVAQAFGENLFGRIELERSDFGKKEFRRAGLSAVRYEPETTRLSVGAGYRF
jgi:opacity protein-like surface antigen